ncbi:MAG: hypothetical protein HZA53_14405 [Planctomycetes bacterium]|nr:hypothetical protein [Planctomycetota bacterium]
MRTHVSRWSRQRLGSFVALASFSVARAEPPAGADLAAAHGAASRAQSEARFIENAGQWKVNADFVASTPTLCVRAEARAIGLQIFEHAGDSSRGVFIRFEFVDAEPLATLVGEDPWETEYNWFRGNDPKAWVRGAHAYRSLRWRGLYPGIDLVLHLGPSGPKYDLLLAPGAELGRFQVRIEGITALEARGLDGLALRTALGDLEHSIGPTWRVEQDESHTPIHARAVARGDCGFGIELDAPPQGRPVVIDPGLIWSTYVGASGVTGVGDETWTVTFGPDGDVYAAGETDGTDFPVTPGSYQNFPSTGLYVYQDVFVSRFRANDGALLYSCVIGGGHYDRPLDMAVDGQSRATVVGYTFSDDFPITPGALQASQSSPNEDAFVLRFNASGNVLLLSTFLAGSNGSMGQSVAIAASGAIIVGGQAYSADFPTTSGAFQTQPITSLGNDPSFLARLSPDGTALEWSTFVSGVRIQSLVLASNEDVVFGGDSGSGSVTTPGAFQRTCSLCNNAGFVGRLAANGSQLQWATLFSWPFAGFRRPLAA